MVRIHLAQYVNLWQALVNKLMNICFHGIDVMSSLVEEIRDSYQGFLMLIIAFDFQVTVHRDKFL